MFGFRNLKIYQSFDSATYFFAYYDLRSLLLKWRRRRCWQNTALVFHTYFFAYPSSIVTPCWSVLEFKKKIKLENSSSMNWIFSLQKSIWKLIFASYTGSKKSSLKKTKNPVRKTWFFQIDFSEIQYRSTGGKWISVFFCAKFRFSSPFQPLWLVVHRKREKGGRAFTIWSA